MFLLELSASRQLTFWPRLREIVTYSSALEPGIPARSDDESERHHEVEPDINDYDDRNADADNFELTNEIPTEDAAAKSHHRHRGAGYHASSAPTDFMKKKYKSELLHVS